MYGKYFIIRTHKMQVLIKNILLRRPGTRAARDGRGGAGKGTCTGNDNG